MRAVFQNRLGMGDSLLEGHGVDEGLERGAWRAERLRQVHRAGALVGEIAGTTDAGADGARRLLDDDDGGRELRPQRLGPLLREALERRLPAGVDGQAMHAIRRSLAHGRLRDMGRQHREGPARRRHRLAGGMKSLALGDHTSARRDGEHAVAATHRTFGEAVGPPHLRRLRQGDQCRGFRMGEPARVLAEIGEARGANALDVAAEGGERKVKREDLVLGEAPLQLDGARRLPELGAERPLVARLDQPCHLHRDRRTARDDAAVAQRLADGPHHRQRIDAMMRAEAPVLEGEQHLDIARIDILDRRRHAPAPVRHGEGAQELAVAVEHDGGALRRRRKIERRQARPGDGEGCEGGKNRYSRDGKDRAPSPSPMGEGGPRSGSDEGQPPTPGCSLIRPTSVGHLPPRGKEITPFAHRAAWTSATPEAARPKRSGRYMSSTKAPGWM